MYTIPFDSETLKEIITGTITSPKIDYKNCKIKGKNFITYLSNLKYENLNIDFSDVSFVERSELISEFIKHNSTCQITQFESTIIKCLFSYKNYDLSLVDISEDDKGILQTCIFSNVEIQVFVEENKNLIKQLSELLDGTILYAIKNLNAYREELGGFVTNNIIVDKTDIGKTFVNLFGNPTFNCHYYGALPKFDDLIYFDHYFDRPIYSGKTLINFISSPNCVLFPLLKMIIDVQYTPEQLKTISEQLDATPI